MLRNFWKIEFLKEYRQARTLQKWWKFVLSQFVLRKYFLAKLFVPLIKESVSPQCYAIFWKLNFWRNIDMRGPYKNGEYLYYLKLCKEIIFWQNYLFHSSKEEFLNNFRQFWKIEFLKEFQQARTLQKWWKFVLSQFVLRKYFLTKLFVPLIKGRVSPQFYAIFRKLNFWRNIDRRGPYKNGENLYYLNLCYENIFLQNFLFHSSKEVFLHKFRQFLENWIFEGISTGATLQKWWKFVLSQFVLRKYFLAKLFIPPIKRYVSPHCYAIFGKLNFWRNIDRRGPYKNGENLYYLNLC